MSKSIDLDEIKKLIVHPRLGELLLQRKKIKVHQLTEALEEKKRTNSELPIGRILINKGFILENDLIELLSLQSNIDKLLQDSYKEIEKLNGDSSEN